MIIAGLKNKISVFLFLKGQLKDLRIFLTLSGLLIRGKCQLLYFLFILKRLTEIFLESNYMIFLKLLKIFY